MPKRQMPELPIRFFRIDGGREPVLDWLRNFDKGESAHHLMRVQFGWPIGIRLFGV